MRCHIKSIVGQAMKWNVCQCLCDICGTMNHKSNRAFFVVSLCHYLLDIFEARNTTHTSDLFGGLDKICPQEKPTFPLNVLSADHRRF